MTADLVAARIGDRLRNARELARLSQVQAATLLGVAGNTICGWETGERMPRAPELIAMCEHYRCTADYLLGRTEHPGSLPVGDLFVDWETVHRVKRARTEAEVERLVDWNPPMIGFWTAIRSKTRAASPQAVHALTVELTEHIQHVAPALWRDFASGLKELLRSKRRWILSRNHGLPGPNGP